MIHNDNDNKPKAKYIVAWKGGRARQYYIEKVIELPTKTVYVTYEHQVGFLSEEEIRIIDDAL